MGTIQRVVHGRWYISPVEIQRGLISSVHKLSHNLHYLDARKFLEVSFQYTNLSYNLHYLDARHSSMKAPPSLFLNLVPPCNTHIHASPTPYTANHNPPPHLRQPPYKHPLIKKTPRCLPTRINDVNLGSTAIKLLEIRRGLQGVKNGMVGVG